MSLVDVDLGYDFREVYMPGHPGADERGYVRADDAMQMTGLSPEAQASYEACLQNAAELEPCGDDEEPVAQSA
jgi:flagellar basal body rod protein FlgC